MAKFVRYNKPCYTSCMNIYILTEEKPKISVIRQLFDIYKSDFHGSYTISGQVLVMPFFKDDYFDFAYELLGIKVEGIDRIILKTVSGSSSFMDFLFFICEDAPLQNDGNLPLFAVEETKTSGAESRNTNAYQRGTKFIYFSHYYPDVPKYMLYNDELEENEDKTPTDTEVFGTRALLTLGVKYVGKKMFDDYTPFTSVDELVDSKNAMAIPPSPSNVPVRIKKARNVIQISGILSKPANKGNIAHDPNIGALSVISAALRKLGWEKDIVITRHGVSQEYLNNSRGRNKFLYICSMLNIKLQRLRMPVAAPFPPGYWHYEMSSEKLASILLHIVAEDAGFKEVYQNHAGCERGYFRSPTNELIALPKKTPDGNILLIPDLVFNDEFDKVIYVIEGKKLSTLNLGLEEIQDYDDIENLYIRKHYPKHKIKRAITIFGGNLHDIPDENVLVYLRQDGKTMINDNDKIIQKIFDDCENLKNKIN